MIDAVANKSAGIIEQQQEELMINDFDKAIKEQTQKRSGGVFKTSDAFQQQIDVVAKEFCKKAKR
jgi:hypothetical protein